MEGTLINLVIQALAGAAGGAGAGSAFKDLSMGKPADAISGGVGGAVVGQILGSVMGAGAAATDVGGMDVATLVRDIVGARRRRRGGHGPDRHVAQRHEGLTICRLSSNPGVWIVDQA